MPKGTVVALYGEHGQIMYEGQYYNFNTMIVEGGVKNQLEVEFEFTDRAKIKVIYGTGATKAPAPVQTKKENSSAKLKDTKVLLTEEK
jgi:coenzyme F420-reducing hydrogenase gamma subunit